MVTEKYLALSKTNKVIMSKNVLVEFIEYKR